MDILLLVMAVAASGTLSCDSSLTVLMRAFVLAFFLATVFLYQTRPPSPPSRSVHSKSLLKMESRASGLIAIRSLAPTRTLPRVRHVVGVFNDEFFQEIKVCCSDRVCTCIKHPTGALRRLVYRTSWY